MVRLPNDMDWLGQLVENISYFNAKEFFSFNRNYIIKYKTIK